MPCKWGPIGAGAFPGEPPAGLMVSKPQLEETRPDGVGGNEVRAGKVKKINKAGPMTMTAAPA